MSCPVDDRSYHKGYFFGPMKLLELREVKPFSEIAKTL
jgi:hypothetical protein